MRHPFTAPPPDADGRSPEGWPVDVPRRITLWLDRIALGVEVCATTSLLAVLPDTVAATSPVPLRRLPVPGLLPLTPIVAHVALPGGPAVEPLLARVRAEIPFPAEPRGR